MISAIPHVDVIGLTCAEEAKALISEAIENFATIKTKGKFQDLPCFFWDVKPIHPVLVKR